MTKKILINLIVLGALVASSLSAYVLLSPRRAWDFTPNVIVDNRGNPTVVNVSGRGRTQVRNVCDERSVGYAKSCARQSLHCEELVARTSQRIRGGAHAVPHALELLEHV